MDSSLLSYEREEGRGDVHICYCRLFVFYDRGYIKSHYLHIGSVAGGLRKADALCTSNKC